MRFLKNVRLEVMEKKNEMEMAVKEPAARPAQRSTVQCGRTVTSCGDFPA